MEEFDPKHALKLAGIMASKVEDVINCGDVMILSDYVRDLNIAWVNYNHYIFEHTK